MSERSKSWFDVLYDEYKARVGGGGFYRVFLDVSDPEVEKRLQDETRSTVRCIPFDAPEEEGPCMITGRPWVVALK